MGNGVAFLSVFFLASDGKPLAQALREGDVSVKARSHSGYSAAALEIRNLRNEPLAIDVNGSYLEPEDQSYQRLGLGLVRAGDSDTTVSLKGRGLLSLKVLSVCMDPSRSGPRNGARYRLAPELAPPEVLACLERWKSRPETPQSEIQSAVWGKSTSRSRPERPAGQLVLPRNTEKVISHGGRLLVLTTEGDLIVTAQDVHEEKAASKVIDLWAGREVYVLREAFSGTVTGVFRTVISRFDPLSGTWSDLPIDAEPGRLMWVAADGGEAIVLARDDRLKRISEGRAVPLLGKARIIEVAPSGRILLVPAKDPGAIDEIDRRGRTLLLYRHRVPIQAIACAGDDIYILDANGSLIDLSGVRPRRLAGEAAWIQAAGERLLSGLTGTSGPLDSRPPAFQVFRSGQRVRSLSLPEGTGIRYVFDPVTGEVLCFDRGLAVERLVETRGAWEPILRKEGEGSAPAEGAGRR